MTNEELVRLYQAGDKNSLDRLIEKNEGIVHKIAHSFYIGNSCNADYEDIEQEGYRGLITAAKKYDFENKKKAQFITYAVYWIKNCIYEFIVGHSSKDVKNNEFYNNCTSLNTPIGDDNNSELLDTIQSNSNDFESLEKKLYIQQLHDDLEKAMSDNLTLKEREILKMNFGWGSMEPLYLVDISKILNMETNEVLNIERRSLRKLRNSRFGRCSIYARENKCQHNYNYRAVEEKVLDEFYIELLKEEKEW